MDGLEQLGRCLSFLASGATEEEEELSVIYFSYITIREIRKMV
jgi:hypothetical protein